MPSIPVPAQFDSIAPVYDRTREPLEPATLDKLVEELRARTIGSILEVGVGTGRIAIPLRAHGLELTGVDASRGMLSRAREKGFHRAVRGNAYRLPFRAARFDLALFAHVLHVLDDTARALAEARRVAHLGAGALVHPRTGAENGPSAREEVWRRLHRVLAEEGYDLPPRSSGGPPVRERAILEAYPPTEIVILSDRSVTEPAAKRLDFLAHGASRHTMHIPREALERAAGQVRKELGERTVTYRRVEALALWNDGS